MRCRTAFLSAVWLAGTNALAAGPTPTSTPFLEITMMGTIAFKLDGCEAAATGNTCSAVALLPRLDRPNSSHLPDAHVYPNFYPNYERYPLHHAVVRVKGKYLSNVSGTPYCDGNPACRERYVTFALFARNPLKPDPPLKASDFYPFSYDISFDEGLTPPPTPIPIVVDPSFKHVAVLYEKLSETGALVPAVADQALLAETMNHQDPRLAARIRFNAGETIEATHPITSSPSAREVETKVRFSYRSLKGCKAVSDFPFSARNCKTDRWTKPKPQPTRSPADGAAAAEAEYRDTLDELAQHAVVKRTLSGDTVKMKLTSHGCLVTTEYELKTVATKVEGKVENKIEVEIMNLPAEEDADLPIRATDNSEIHLEHFNLYHLIYTRAADSKDFFFPAPIGTTRGGRPFCSLAQLK